MSIITSICKNLLKIRLFIFIFQILLQIDLISCGNCKNIHNLLDISCYNDLIIFNDSNWRAGHACTNKDNVTIVEFSLNDEESDKRLFYGLKENGRYYFTEGLKKIDSMVCHSNDCGNYKGRFESRNLFVSLNNDPETQYLFSMSSYKSLVELIKLNNVNDIDSYYAWNTLTFFNLSLPIFSFEFSLFEIGNSNTYIAAFVESAGKKLDENNEYKEFSNTTTILKFQLDNFAQNDYRTINQKIILEDSYNGRVVSAFRLEDSHLIVLVYVRAVADTENKKGKYITKFYNENLEAQNFEDTIYNDVVNLWLGFGIFVKGISVKGDYAAFALYYDGNNQKSLYFLFSKYESNKFVHNNKKEIRFDSYSFRQDVYSNGLYKLDDKRIVLFATEDYKVDDTHSIEYGCLHMFLFDFYNEYAGMKIREYKFYYPEKRFAKEMAAYMYNGYILFTATLSGDNPNITFASMMLFGFGNGTDHEIDISPYLMDTGYYVNSNNLYDYLISKMVIDNNIFDYEKVEKIRLIKICGELLLYKGTYGVNQEADTLPINELFDANHTLLQNKQIEKEENKLYTLEYQYLVKEPDFNTFYGSAINTIDTLLNGVNAGDYYTPETLNGRVNILSFKLCHKYCIKCMEFGNNDNDQKCLNCKEQYTYDYLAAVNNFTGNCVPEGYMYDAEDKELKQCDSVSPHKYYLNVSRSNKKYCFKYNYECPEEYHYLDTSTNQCLEHSPTPTPEPSPSTNIPQIETSTERPTENLVQSSIINSECSGGNELSESCGYLTNNDLYEGIKEKILSGFSSNGESIKYPGRNGYVFEVTTTKNEIESLSSGGQASPVVDISGCEKDIKNANGIPENTPLIIYKFYKEAEFASQKEMQFEVYNPVSHNKLSLSGCKSINLYVPVELSQNSDIYKNIIDQGYDPFDINDKFYREICTQYESENGTDVLLDAREEYYYSPIVNETSCQGNCHYQSYSLDTKYLICECDVSNDGIVTLDVKHFNEKNVAYSFYSSLKLSNYKVVICYNLVFNFKVFCQNYGSILSTIFLGAYVVSMILYSIRNINPLKVEISKFLFDVAELNNGFPNNTKKISSQRRNSKKKTTARRKSIKSNKGGNKALPPKKAKRLSKLSKDTSNSEINLKKNEKSRNIKLDNQDNDIIINSKATNNGLLKKTEKSIYPLVGDSKNTIKIKEKGDQKDNKKDKNQEEEILDPDLLDNFELNDLNYKLACKYDRRTCCHTYISFLLREEIVLLTFVSCNDYNLLYVKISRLLIFALTSMAFNALFFFHKTMYKKQDIEENWTFVQKLPQLLFVLVANHIIEVYLCFLSMTDISVYKIKALSKKPKTSQKIINIIDCMKAKLITFFVSTFILFLLFWYFISAFCAVYKNTQKIFIRDSAISFATSLLDPFLIYGFTITLRRISLSMCCRNKAGCLYKISDIIPIF